MFDLFKQEVQTHAVVMTEALPSLMHNSADSKIFDSLMHAANAIKGAARIVGISAAGDMADALENCFTAAGQNKISINPDRVETLLRIVDMLKSISELPENEATSWGTDNSAIFEKALGDLKAVLATPAKDSEEAPPDSHVQAPKANAVPPVNQKTTFDLADLSMLDLFKQEAETHNQALSQGLLELEKDPTASSLIEPLMRAAHSIKGAARIVGLTPVVNLAHAMEDGFVAAQKGLVTITPENIDVFLDAIDLFAALAETPEENFQDWLSQKAGEFEGLAQIVRNDQSPQPPIPKGTAQPPRPVKDEINKKTEKEAPPPAATPQKKAPDIPKSTGGKSATVRDVRVSAEILSRLMGLAGESVVESKRLSSFPEKILALRKDLFRLAEFVESVRDSLERGDTRDHLSIELAQAIHQTKFLNEGLVRHFNDFESYSMRADDLANRLYGQVLSSRMRPFGEGMQVFPRMVRDLARELGKKVRFDILGENTPVDRDVLKKLEAPLNHILRNGLDHGLETPEERSKNAKHPTGSLTLEARHHAGMLSITIKDDGRGIDTERVRQKVVDRKMIDAAMAKELRENELLDFLLLPGFSTAENVTLVSGRGVGLDVVQSMVQELRGVIRIETTKGAGTQFLLKLPLSLSIIRALLVEIGGEIFALPLHRLEHIFTCPNADICTIENREYVNYQGDNIGLIPATQVLGFEGKPPENENICVVVIGDHANTFGLAVDRFVEERDIAVRPLDPRLGLVQDISAAAVLENGEPILILDVDDMVRSVDNLLSGGRLNRIRAAKEAATVARKRVLVVDDSVTVREVQRHLLESRGYEVKTAVDGVDGLNVLRATRCDLVISDVDMPRMNGLEMVRHIKEDESLKNLPVMIVSYKDRPEDREKGLEAGADHYLVKSSFHDETLIETVVELIGKG